MPKLTRSFVDKVPVPSRGETIIMDDTLKNFGVRIGTSGVRSYFVRTRVHGGRGRQERRLTLGRSDVLTPEEARKRARILLAQARLGEDPGAEKAARREAKTVNDLLDEWLAGPALRDRKGKLRKVENVEHDQRRLDCHIRPVIGKKKLPDVTRREIERLRDAIAAGRAALIGKTETQRAKSRATGGEGAAARTLRTLSIAFSYAVERGYIPINPVRGVKTTPDKSRERFLSGRELERLGHVLETSNENPAAIAIIRLLLLTGCRHGEIAGLKWSEVDLDRGFLRLSDSKTGKRQIYLSEQAADVLRQVHRFAGSPWVFPATSGEGHFRGTGGIWIRIRQRAGLEDVRLHDLRHTFASQAINGGAPIEVIAELLGHKDTRTTRRYAHLAADRVQEAAARTASVISSAMQGATVG